MPKLGRLLARSELFEIVSFAESVPACEDLATRSDRFSAPSNSCNSAAVNGRCPSAFAPAFFVVVRTDSTTLARQSSSPTNPPREWDTRCSLAPDGNKRVTRSASSKHSHRAFRERGMLECQNPVTVSCRRASSS